MAAEDIKTLDQELDKMAGGVLGGGVEEPSKPEPIDPSQDNRPDGLYWGMKDVKFDDAERVAYQRLEEYAHQQYAVTSKRMVMDGYGGSVVIGGMPLTERMITALVYETLLQNRDKYFVDPNECPTASTDGEAIYLNPYFTAWLTPQELAFILAHEINHIMLHHIGENARSEAFIYGYKGGRNDARDGKIDRSKAGVYNFRADIANIATDLIINDQLIKDKIGTLPLYKESEGKLAGTPMACYIPGFSEFDTEESIVKFSNAVCKNGYNLVHKSFKARGVDIEPPQYKEFHDMTQARIELENLYNYIHESVVQYCQNQQKQQGNQQQGQSGQSQGSSGQGSQQGQSQGLGGQQQSQQEISPQSGGQEQGQQGGSQGSGGSGSQSQDKRGKGGKGSDKGSKGQQGQERGTSSGGRKGNNNPPMNAQGELDEMASGAIQDAINNALNNEMADQIIDAISKALTQGMGGGKPLDSHQTTDDLMNDMAKEQGKDVGDVERQISESAGIMASKVVEKLEGTYGITPDQLKGIGSIGANIVAKWEARQVKARRPYDVMLMRLFKLVKGQSRDTYARHNKKTTVINKALKNYAKKAGTEPSRVIIPNKLSESGKIVIAIDTSGSIFADPQVGTMAVEEILRLTDTLNRQYMGSAIEVVMCDTELHKYGQANNRYEMQKMLDNVKTNGVNVLGGGGTDLLPIWEYVKDETKNARKKGQMPPSGLLVLTDTQTMNLDKISDLYRNREIRIPTVILAPSDDIKHCQEWQDLAKECPYFMLADIDEIQQRSQSRASHSLKRNAYYEYEMEH